jgi:hypothetical protein
VASARGHHTASLAFANSTIRWPPDDRAARPGHRSSSAAEKVLERMVTSKDTVLVIKREADGKMRGA